MTSVAETIAANIVATVGAVAAFAAPTAGGCKRSSSDGDALLKFPVAVVVSRDETKSRGPFPAVSCRLSFEIHIVDHPDSASATTWESHIDTLLRAVEKALMVDPERGLGGNSGVDTEIVRHLKYLMANEADENVDNIAAALFVDVTYRHVRTDPEVSI